MGVDQVQRVRRLKGTLFSRVLEFSLPLFVLASGIILSLFRNALRDETYYLNDAAWMAECMRHGQWFGNEGVGLHGFLLKMPAALLFLLFGPSVFAATITTVVMATIAVWLCYRLLRSLLKSETWAWAGCWIIVTTYSFVECLPTFLRDIPALLIIVFLLDAILNARGKWWIGVLLLLLLDAKETTFFMFAPAFAVWVVLDELKDSGRGRWRRIGIRWIAGFLPAIIYVGLMLCTGLVPLNVFLVRVMGLTEVWSDNVVDPFLSWMPAGNAADRYRTLLAAGSDGNLPNGFLATILRYVEKLFHPKTFSVMTVSKIIVLPALVMSIRLFREWRKAGETKLLVFSLITWISLAAYLPGITVGRYLLPFVPVLVYFFLRFVMDGLRDSRFALIVLLVTFCAVALELWFELYMAPLKMLLALTPVVLIGVVAWEHARARSWASHLAFAPVLLIGLSGLATAMASSCIGSKGQISNYLLFGYNRECKEIVGKVPADSRIWISCYEWNKLAPFYRGDAPSTSDSVQELRSFVPKKSLMVRSDGRTYTSVIKNIDGLEKMIRENRIDRVVLVVSTDPRITFRNQGHAEQIRNADWLELGKTMSFKNKTVEVFAVEGTE